MSAHFQASRDKPVGKPPNVKVKSGWQSIDTAPKDKTRFLAFGMGHGNRRGSYDTNEKPFPMYSVCWWDWFEGEREIPVGDGLFKKEPCRELEFWRCEWSFIPTHWMPLPEAP